MSLERIESMPNDDRRIAAGLFLLTFIAYAFFFGGGGWNQNAHFDMTRAIVERRTFAIDAYRANTFDIAEHGGHVYANKPPGLSLIACIPYALLFATESALGMDVNAFATMTVNLWLCTAGVCATSGALLISLLFRYLRRFIDARNAAAIAIAIAFGTYLFAYSTVLFLHVPSALFLFWSFTRLDKPWLAGVLGGLAVLCNYAALPALAAIALIGARKRLLPFIAGGMPFAVVLFAYQWICFGSPLRTSIQAESTIFHTVGAPIGVLVMPRLDVLAAILFSRYRGLFFLSPILILAIAGAVVMLKNRLHLRELLIVASVFASFVAINISFNNWHGGSAAGPRYILPVVPFLAIPIAFVVDRMRGLFVALASVSCLFNFVIVAVNPLPSNKIADPIFRYAIPLLLTGRLPADTPKAPPYAWKVSLGHVSVNRQGVDELVPFMNHAPGSDEAEWASFNVGELVAAGSVLSLAPILLWMVGGSAVLLKRA